MVKFEKHQIEKHPTDIYGLRWLPMLALSGGRGTIDGRAEGVWDAGLYDPFSDCCKSVIKSNMEELGSSLKCIVEIGVDRDANSATMTKHLLAHKMDNVIYLGVDIDDKSYLNDPDKNIYTICTDSSNHQLVIDKLAELRVQSIDLLFIDGNHSIDGVVNDWQYVEQLSSYGIVLMHDIRGHPGPYCVFDAIDPALFEKEKFCMDDDYGIAKIVRKPGK